MNQEDVIKSKGDIDIIIKYVDGSSPSQKISISNALLDKGRAALAKSLANDIGDSYSFFISNMLFGNGGATGSDVPLLVNTNRTGLFGTTVLSKAVISAVDPQVNSQVVFTSTMKASEAVGEKINELALKMNNNELYSMATFAGVNKTSNMEITFNWRLSFI